jgi:predicted transcriptional regulator of viral defense system
MRQNRARLQEWFRDHDGIITRRVALRLGLSSDQILRKLTSGEWVQIHRGVYRNADVPFGPRARLRGAIAAGGQAAGASHRSAAWVHGLIDEPPEVPTITVPRSRVVRAQGLRAVRSRQPVPLRRYNGIRCTDPLRTLMDCACECRPEELDAMLDRGLAHKTLRFDAVQAAVLNPPLQRDVTRVGAPCGLVSKPAASSGPPTRVFWKAT